MSETKEFKSITFALLTYNQVVADMYKETPEGKVRRLINDTMTVPLESIVFIDGKPVVYRYISDCDEIIKSKQIAIDKDLYGANRSFTTADYDGCRFIDGLLVTRQQNQNDYLMAIGKYKDLPSNVKRPKDVFASYQIHDPMAGVEKENDFTFAIAEAAVKFRGLPDDDKKNLLTKIFGAHYIFEDNKNVWNTHILSELSKSEDLNRTALDLILNYSKEEKKLEDDLDTIISKALNLKLLDFDTNPKEIIGKGKPGGKGAKIMEVPDTADYETKVSLLKNYLTTAAGSNAYNVLKASLKT
jgi:hypothetical protein